MRNNFINFFESYTDKLNSYLNNIDKKSLLEFEVFFKKLINNKKTLFLAGNGGSAATASTIANDLGFDLFKNRIGYGGGYYDRTIEYLEKKNEVLKLGIAFDEQEIMKIPKEKYDKKLDIIVTPTRLII